MRMPDPIWPMNYSASRRKHRHRCQTCWRIVKDGEPVLMARITGRRTRVVHDTEECARVSMQGMTAARRLELHGLEYLQACGFLDAKRLLDEQRAREIAEHEREETA